LQCHSAAVVAPPGEAGRLCFISSNLAGCSLVRIVEEELIAVEIIDHRKPAAHQPSLTGNLDSMRDSLNVTPDPLSNMFKLMSAQSLIDAALVA
jgi:hypothetical protein